MNAGKKSTEGDGRPAVEIVTPATGESLKQLVGERVTVEAEVRSHAREAVSAAIKVRKENSTQWTVVPMHFLSGHRWRGEFFVLEAGDYVYVAEAWEDPFKGWRTGLQKEIEGAKDIASETLHAGVRLINGMVGHATALDAERLHGWAGELLTGNSATGQPLIERALDQSLATLMTDLAGSHSGLRIATTPENKLQVTAAAGGMKKF